MAFYGKEYKIDRTENVEEFVNSLGLPEDKKKEWLKARNPKKIVKNADGTYAISSSSTPIVFTPGVESEYKFPNMTTKMTITIDGNTVSMVNKVGDQIFNSKMEFTDSDLVETVTSPKSNVSAKYYYRA